MDDNITIRQLKPSDIPPNVLESFHHEQMITRKWVKREDRYELVDTSESCEWSSKKRVWVAQYLRRQAENGGAVIGAFCGGKLAGFAALDGALHKASKVYANLTMFFVDNEWKRRGIGRELFRQICRHAEKLGSEKLFISAVPSYETVAFYFSMGCTDAEQVIEEFIDTEYDRYLEYAVR